MCEADSVSRELGHGFRGDGAAGLCPPWQCAASGGTLPAEMFGGKRSPHQHASASGGRCSGVGPARLERATSCSGGKRSIQLSYGPWGWGRENSPPDSLSATAAPLPEARPTHRRSPPEHRPPASPAWPERDRRCGAAPGESADWTTPGSACEPGSDCRVPNGAQETRSAPENRSPPAR